MLIFKSLLVKSLWSYRDLVAAGRWKSATFRRQNLKQELQLWESKVSSTPWGALDFLAPPWRAVTNISTRPSVGQLQRAAAVGLCQQWCCRSGCLTAFFWPELFTLTLRASGAQPVVWIKMQPRRPCVVHSEDALSLSVSFTALLSKTNQIRVRGFKGKKGHRVHP